MIKKMILLLVVMSATLLASTINIAVAANVSYAMDELKSAFNKEHPEINVRVTLGSSGKLTAQIKNGAPYSVFMSANMKYPQSLYDDKLSSTVPVVYAQGALAYLSKTPQDFSSVKALLTSDKIERIAIANPKIAPYGKAAYEAMTNMKIIDQVKPKFVYAESISQTVSYTITATDIGFIAKSSLYSPKMSEYKEGVNWMSFDSKDYTPIEQGIVILKSAEDKKAAQAFYDFILSEKAKEIFRNYGYSVN